ncbi:MAG: methylase involved in ubiquinone/menaquinone biosynthesis [Haloquadratum walsbyi J07HQW1]|uniref:Methylase involved in ubiquinone/menaquinone biosynthesis n=1 Tax=Haloquadratum walsbyi J07HQW1 TaxID=1238424 RepID=U1PIX2_9EURY|nr:MAG: methylase involved in ubiquinone/menaquinone biosynthesis [Haloquadratum walsbyi J07HQW1]
MVDKEAVLDGYDTVARVYTEERSRSDKEHKALSSLLHFLSLESRVLDAGCGGGKPVLRQLSSQLQQTIGLDFSTKQLEIAASKAPEATLLCGDMTQVPLTDGCVDAIFASHSLIHIPADTHQTVIDEFARVLRPGGRLLVSEGPQKWEGTNRNWLDAGAEMQWDIAGPETTRAQLETAGFHIETEYGAPNTLDEDEDEEAGWIFFETTLTHS